MILASDWIDNIPDEEGPSMDPEYKDLIASLVDELPEEYRLIIEAIIYERLSFRDAAQRLGYKAHSHLYYKYQEALEMIGAELAGEYGDD